ncbi:MAG: ATP-dependent DNA helicase [Candidatus Magasanikbacteria bacterium CG10_big_fil_rev_8_21_14_0_10_40_10]|uniref:DNA 3'-5' helicase n=1 Tax=Candidatus Magasanikbacteria bacterium CG10_big_fil_rev_8_21_14_0_10_40_10 TaxID=1974648 RepID=A0A2M6W5A4_9BACT|nr:MAG: ATP-dependent DNA helicase [Candidatus Magasanikbacteria bacterium CG10_big_fil_rev_8_21_14_0_10_40_10]
MINYQSDLNFQQLSVVQNGDGPCLVLAGAGSGKTRTITYRVAYLLEKGVNPQNILLLTFTNKAANEMIARIKILTGQPAKLPFSGTFHSLANKILRQYANLIGYQNNFSILDEDDSQALLKLSLKKFKPNTDGRFASVKVLKSIISYARNAQITIDDVLDLKYPQWLQWTENIKNMANDYADQKKQANAMDFDDLLLNWLLILNRLDIQKILSNQFEYILVDEYQDTNQIQASIVRQLSLIHNNVLAVGDDAQSIYSFRAADVKNILDFAKKFPNAKIFKLEINYRSTQEILELANDVIANNLKQYQKELRTLTSTGIKPILQPQADQSQEARFVVSRIKDKLEAGLSSQEIAVLFRAAFHSQMLEMELIKAGIAYDYRGGLRFFDRAHIKDVLSYLRLFNNLADVPAWLRVLRYEEGIGPSAAEKIVSAVKSAGNVDEIIPIGQNILGNKAKQGWYNFTRIWERLLEIDKKDISALIMSIKESRYSEYLEAEYVDARERLQDIEQLAVFAEGATDLSNFLAEVGLQESYAGPLGLTKSTVQNNEKIVLSTIHQAKGLEWDSVFVINLASGGFPSDYAFKERGGLEEERRLFYVAITRAKRNLYLTYPYEGHGYNSGGPSLFLEEISSSLLDDKSFLNSSRSLVLDDETKNVHYISEEDAWKPKPGSFLRDVDDL